MRSASHTDGQKCKKKYTMRDFALAQVNAQNMLCAHPVLRDDVRIGVAPRAAAAALECPDNRAAHAMHAVIELVRALLH